MKLTETQIEEIASEKAKALYGETWKGNPKALHYYQGMKDGLRLAYLSLRLPISS